MKAAGKIPDPKGQTCAAEALQYLRHETYKSSRRKEIVDSNLW